MKKNDIKEYPYGYELILDSVMDRMKNLSKPAIKKLIKDNFHLYESYAKSVGQISYQLSQFDSI